jgi:DNA-binding NtrC family response regulator
MPATSHRSTKLRQRQQLVLIFSHDPLAAALLGGLVETLGYEVHFRRPPELVEDTLRRVRPRVCLVDCADADACREDFLGRATMRGVSVVIFGTREAIEHVRALAAAYQLGTLLMPPNGDDLEALLQQACAD